MTRWTNDVTRKELDADPTKITDDPLAALGLKVLNGRKSRIKEQVYSISRVNPLFNFSPNRKKLTQIDEEFPHYLREKTPEIDYYENDYVELPRKHHHQKSIIIRDKSSSSGYEGSNGESSLDSSFHDNLRNIEESGAILEQNSAFIKSIKFAANRGLKPLKLVPLSHQSSSSIISGGLTTIPEGKVDLPVPQPIWPGPENSNFISNNNNYDSIVDDALLLYTSLNNNDHKLIDEKLESYMDISVKDLLLDLLVTINETLEYKTRNPEEMLHLMTEKIQLKLDELINCTEDEMRRLCINLSNNRKINSVIRALSHSSSSNQSSTSGSRARTLSSHDEEIYHIPSNSSSSEFSDSPQEQRRISTPFLQSLGRRHSILSHLHHHHEREKTSTLSRGIRNALIYGTLSGCKISMNQKIPEEKAFFESNNNFRVLTSNNNGNDQCIKKTNSFGCDKKIVLNKINECEKNNNNDNSKPSVWQMYYGIKAEGSKKYGLEKPTDIPVFPGGRPEADFTLDLPRSELLSKRLRDDKKWRFRCRVLTSFLGLVFFLLSVMAVSLILTRGKRMFGSMV